MYEITVNSGRHGTQKILVDEEDFERVNQFHWGVSMSPHGILYAERKVWRRTTIKMHRYILGLTHGDGKMVDHINGNGLDNRKVNLRLSNHSKNAFNSWRHRDPNIWWLSSEE